MPIPLQTEKSPFYPLFNKLAGVDTVYSIRLKGNTSTSFALNSAKTYQIVPQNPQLDEEFNLFIPNTRFFTNLSGGLSTSYTTTLQGKQFNLTTVSDITRVTDKYGQLFNMTITGVKSGATLNISFTFNAAGQPMEL